ncbi:MAG TPA: ComF family protein [Verrucomicrobia bacterium]|nr:ComF family protein [Verrucomicrobiota bacterium]
MQEPLCGICGTPFDGEITTKFECGNCRSFEFSFDQARSAVRAEGVLLEILHRYKYEKAHWFEPLLVDLLVKGIRKTPNATLWDWVVPVPLHGLKLREREFNQAERLAVSLSDNFGISVKNKLLIRVKDTESQTRLTKKERKSNVSGAFLVPLEVSVIGRNILLIDDVFTTGSTTDECAKALKSAGAGYVDVWTVARGV